MEYEQNIPDFMKKYYQGTNYEGQVLLNDLAKKFEEERATFLQTTFVDKLKFQRDWNKLTGGKKELTAEEALRPMHVKYEAKAKEIAVAHGYVERETAEQKLPGQKEKSVSTPQDELPEREAFLKSLKATRVQAAEKHQQTASSDQQPQMPQTDPEKMRAHLKTLHKQNAEMTQKPRL